MRSLNTTKTGSGAWISRFVAFKWYRRARRIFNYGFSPQEQKLGSAIMLFGVSPQENLGDAPWARSDVIVLESRCGFYPRVCPRNQCTSIGSGNDVEIYMRELSRINHEPFQFMQVESGGPGTGGFALVIDLAMTLRERRVPGISEYVHMLRVWRGRIELSAMLHSDFSEEGIPIDRTMPDVARSWVEFAHKAEQLGYTAMASA